MAITLANMRKKKGLPLISKPFVYEENAFCYLLMVSFVWKEV